MKDNRLYTPEGTADLLISSCNSSKELQDKFLDSFKAYGYDIVEPPMFEYIDVFTDKKISRDEINQYYTQIAGKIKKYLSETNDNELLLMPDNCEYSRFTLILAQYRHLHSHMGMIMGFIIEDTGMWPRVVGLERPIPVEPYNKFF